MTSTPPDLGGADLDGTVVSEVLRGTDKSLVARGRRAGRPVVIKVLRTEDPWWQAKFAAELRVYEALAAHPAPVTTPELLHTDGSRVLIVEHLPGRPVDTERYPTAAVPATQLTAILDAAAGFARWRPAPTALAPIFDYPDRVERYHRSGYFDTRDRAALHQLLGTTGAPAAPAHGDPLPSNLLVTDTAGCALVDFEFTGLFLPGFDLAMLHTLLAATPGAQQRIDDEVRAAAIDTPFLINQAMVLSRERRLHTELDDGPLRRERLAFLEPQWQRLRSRLHAVATRRS